MAAHRERAIRHASASTFPLDSTQARFSAWFGHCGDYALSTPLAGAWDIRGYRGIVLLGHWYLPCNRPAFQVPNGIYLRRLIKIRGTPIPLKPNTVRPVRSKSRCFHAFLHCHPHGMGCSSGNFAGISVPSRASTRKWVLCGNLSTLFRSRASRCGAIHLRKGGSTASMCDGSSKQFQGMRKRTRVFSTECCVSRLQLRSAVHVSWRRLTALDLRCTPNLQARTNLRIRPSGLVTAAW